MEEQLADLKGELELALAAQQAAEAGTAQLAQKLEAQTESTERLQALEQELNVARDEAELLLLLLHQAQEELEYYFLFSHGQSQGGQEVSCPSVMPVTRQADAAVVNAKRDRLLSGV